MSTNLLIIHFRSLEVKSKEEQVEKEIFRVFTEYKSLQYVQLQYEIKNFPSATIDKYLKKMVKEGTILHIENSYQMVPYLREFLEMFQERHEDVLANLLDEIKVNEFYVTMHTESVKTSKDKTKQDVLFANTISKDVARWYSSYATAMFLAITGTFPTVIEKEIKRKCNLQLKQIEEFMKFVKAENGFVHVLLTKRSSTRWKNPNYRVLDDLGLVELRR